MSDDDIQERISCAEYLRARIAEYVTIPIVARRRVFAIDHVIMGIDLGDKNPGFNIVMLDQVYADVISEFAPYGFTCISAETWGIQDKVSGDTFFDYIPEFEGSMSVSWIWTDGRWHENDQIALHFDCETDAILARMALKLPCS